MQDDVLQLLEVLFGQVVFAHEFVLSGVELPLVTFLLLGLERLKDGGSDHQVGEDADDEGESPRVLSLHAFKRNNKDGRRKIKKNKRKQKKRKKDSSMCRWELRLSATFS